MTRIASIKETGEEISQADWARFDAAVAREKAERLTLAPTLKSDKNPKTTPPVDHRIEAR